MGTWQWLQKLPCLPFSSPVQFSFCFLSSHGHLTMFAYAFWLVQLDRPTPVNSEHTHRIYGMVAPWCALSTQSGHETHFLFKSLPKIYMRIVLGAHMRVARTKRWKWKISSFDIQRNFHMTPGMWDGECEQEKRGREQQTFLKSDLYPNLTMTHSCLCRQCNKSSGARIGILNTTKYLNELIPGYQSGSPLKTSK